MRKAIHILHILIISLLILPSYSRDFEIRGIWMQATQIKDERTAELIAERIASAKLNAVFVLVFYWGGKSFFKTDLSPLAYNSPNDSDLFAYFIEQCHNRGIRVLARFSNGKEGEKGGEGILTENPQWQIENKDGIKARWFDLGKREVRDFQLGLISELLNKYPVDGIQLDYIRFPSRDYCYCEECRDSFKRIYQFDPLSLPYALPNRFWINSTPLTNLCGAKLLARFDNGVPAITIREYNAGYLLLFNWQIENSSAHLFLDILKRAMEGKRKIYVLSPGAEVGYDENGYGLILQILRKANLKWEMMKEVSECNPNETLLLLPALKRLRGNLDDEIKDFLNAGGNVIVSSSEQGLEEARGCEELLGICGRGRKFRGNHLLIPLQEHPLIPVLLGGEGKRREIWEKWVDFRKEIITSFVKELYDNTKAIKSSLLFSAAVFYNKASAEKVMQDWYRWLDMGIVDFAAPMAYVDNAHLVSALREWKQADPNLEKIIPGLSIYKVKNGREVTKDYKKVIKQIELIRNEGARGFILFSLPFLSDDLAKYLSSL
jgi:uncharacterized lipoprotein YddW (UPF0748 family)